LKLSLNPHRLAGPVITTLGITLATKTPTDSTHVRGPAIYSCGR
jgi:hypothetical protein